MIQLKLTPAEKAHLYLLLLNRVWNKTDNGTYHHQNGIED